MTNEQRRRWHRRQMLGMLAAAPAAWAARSLAQAAEEGGAPPRTAMGVTSASFALRFSKRSPAGAPLNDPLEFLKHCHALGAGGIQTSLGTKAPADVTPLRSQAETWEMYVEGSVRMPSDRGELERFEAEIRAVRDAGGSVARTVMLGTRRYETFHSAEAFREFAARSRRSLELAEPVVARQRVHLAVENHKDWRVDELLDGLKRVSSEYVGICVDTGNSISLLEEPHEVVAAYAPLARSVHFKDMDLREYDDGFLLSEVPLGAGILDLAKVVETLRRANPKIRFSLEMITRDPLKVPCLTDDYWSTLAAVPGRDLARTLSLARRRASREPLPAISGLAPEEQLRFEEANVVKCLAYAREQLGL